jgi:WD40 repeat protein
MRRNWKASLAVRRIAGLAALATVLAVAAPAGAAPSPIPDVGTVQTDGTVSAVAQAGGKVFLGGNFSRAGKPTLFGAVFAGADGSVNPAFAPTRKNVTGITGTVADGNGGFYVGESVNSATTLDVAHLLGTGSYDPNFQVPVNGNVTSMILSGSTLYIAGAFSTVGSPAVTRNGVAAISTATGVPTSFDPGLSTHATAAMALSPDGSTLYVSGTFTTVNAGATARPGGVAGFATSTGLATSFAPTLASGTDPMSLATSHDGTRVYMGGAFQTVDGVTDDFLAAVNASDGSLIPAFNPHPNNVANAIVVSADGNTVYATGNFTTVNGGAASREGLAAFNASDGSVIPGFNANIATNFASTLALSADGSTLYAGGSFISVNAGGTVSRDRAAAFNASTGALLGFDPNLDSTVTHVAVSGANVFVSGAFEFAGASTIYNRLIEINPDGTLDTTFDPNINNTVAALAVSPDGDTLYVGGTFTAVNGSTALSRLIALDTTTGLPTAFSPGVNSNVAALALTPDGGTLYAGGIFTMVNGSIAENRLAAFNTTTGVATAFNPNLNDNVNAIALSPDGTTVYAAGQFTTVNGGVAENRLAAFNSTTGVATAFNPNVNNTIDALAVSPDGATVFAGGTFTTVNGSTTENRLAAFNATTGVATAFNANLNFNALALAMSPDGSTLYAGGQFATANGSTAVRFLASFDPSTGIVGTFTPVMNGGLVDALALTPDGNTLYAGGTFTSVGTTQQISYAQFSPAATAPAATTAGASGITGSAATLAGTVGPGGAATSYVFEYGTSTSFGSITGPVGAGSGESAVAATGSLTGLSPNTTYLYRVVAANSLGTTFGAVASFTTTGAPSAPAVLTQGPTSIGDTTATLAGQVDPEGQATAFAFEYGTTPGFGAITTPVELDSAGSGESVSAVAAGLTPNTTYYYRLVATNASGTSTGSVISLTTGPGGPPGVTTGVASAVTQTGATLTGTVDALGEQTTFTFEFGTTTSFGSLSPVDEASPIAGPQTVSLPIGGLAPGTLYLYRLVATNAGGTTAGPVQSFATAPAP